MVGGHFATALIAKQQAPHGPLAFYLVISQLPDLLWHAFHFLGLEPTLPANPMMASLDNMQAEMTYSHDLLPTLGLVVLVVLAGRGLFGSWRPGWTGGILILAHMFCDAISGHTHHVFGPESPAIGLGLYATAPYLALAVEGVFTLGVMAWVFQADAKAAVRRSRATLMVWAVVFAGGLMSMVPSADLSLVEMTGIAPIEALSGTLMPGLIAMYLAMFAALLWADARPTSPIPNA
ncbi:MAG: hypothetical protein GWP91_25000 [Rhodobacterales bacterium]|nr:hypothetical protein [Rhodobacterales bacterium]